MKWSSYWKRDVRCSDIVRRCWRGFRAQVLHYRDLQQSCDPTSQTRCAGPCGTLQLDPVLQDDSARFHWHDEQGGIWCGVVTSDPLRYPCSLNPLLHWYLISCDILVVSQCFQPYPCPLCSQMYWIQFDLNTMYCVQVNGWKYLSLPVGSTDLGMQPSYGFCAELCSTFWRNGRQRSHWQHWRHWAGGVILFFSVV